MTFAIMSSIGILTAFTLLYFDWRLNNGVLQKPSKDESEEVNEEQEELIPDKSDKQSMRDRLKKSLRKSIARASMAR